MPAEEATKYRGMVARCKFLGCGRPDTQYAAKAASRWTASPSQGDYEKVARIGKCRRLVQSSPFGKDDGVVMAYSD